MPNFAFGSVLQVGCYPEATVLLWLVQFCVQLAAVRGGIEGESSGLTDVNDLEEVVEANVLECAPPIISTGARCMGMGHSLSFKSGCRPALACPSGMRGAGANSICPSRVAPYTRGQPRNRDKSREHRIPRRALCVPTNDSCPITVHQLGIKQQNNQREEIDHEPPLQGKNKLSQLTTLGTPWQMAFRLDNDHS